MTQINQPPTFGILDANNLYGWAMSQYLPVRDFEWEETPGTIEEYMAVPKDASKGYILEVELGVPTGNTRPSQRLPDGPRGKGDTL